MFLIKYFVISLTCFLACGLPLSDLERDDRNSDFQEKDKEALAKGEDDGEDYEYGGEDDRFVDKEDNQKDINEDDFENLFSGQSRKKRSKYFEEDDDDEEGNGGGDNVNKIGIYETGEDYDQIVNRLRKKRSENDYAVDDDNADADDDDAGNDLDDKHVDGDSDDDDYDRKGDDNDDDNKEIKLVEDNINFDYDNGDVTGLATGEDYRRKRSSQYDDGGDDYFDNDDDDGGDDDDDDYDDDDDADDDDDDDDDDNEYYDDNDIDNDEVIENTNVEYNPENGDIDDIDDVAEDQDIGDKDLGLFRRRRSSSSTNPQTALKDLNSEIDNVLRRLNDQNVAVAAKSRTKRVKRFLFGGHKSKNKPGTTVKPNVTDNSTTWFLADDITNNTAISSGLSKRLFETLQRLNHLNFDVSTGIGKQKKDGTGIDINLQSLPNILNKAKIKFPLPVVVHGRQKLPKVRYLPTSLHIQKYDFNPNNDLYDFDNNQYENQDEGLTRIKRDKRDLRHTDYLPKSDLLGGNDDDDDDLKQDDESFGEVDINETQDFDIMEHDNPEGIGVHDLQNYKGPRSDMSLDSEVYDESSRKRKRRSNPTPSRGKLSGGEAIGALKPFNGEPLGIKPKIGRPLGSKPVGHKPMVGKPLSDEPFNRTLTNDNPKTDNSVGGKPLAIKHKAVKPVGIKPIAGKPVGGRPLASKPVGGKPLAGKLVGGKPGRGTTIAGKPVGGKPVGGNPMAGKPVSRKPMAGKHFGGKGFKARKRLSGNRRLIGPKDNIHDYLRRMMTNRIGRFRNIRKPTTKPRFIR